jgi:hypothetical protein
MRAPATVLSHTFHKNVLFFVIFSTKINSPVKQFKMDKRKEQKIRGFLIGIFLHNALVQQYIQGFIKEENKNKIYLSCVF